MTSPNSPRSSGAGAPTRSENALAEVLDRHTVEGSLWRTETGRIRCLACGHRCLIPPGRRGICKVRFNAAGRLRVPFGYVAGVQCDPIEKKPFFHVYPGGDALTFGMLGCDFHCSYCQNWVTSQALRDDSARVPIQTVTPSELAAAGRRLHARLAVSSYNEPLITAEWAVAVFQEAKTAGLDCAFVSNGNATPEALDFLQPWIVAYKIDLKGFDPQRYRTLGGTLDCVLDSIRMVHQRRIWLEVVTLLVPGFNDSETELRALTDFLVSVSPDIPWHVTAFHPDYKLTGPSPTQAAALVRAAEIGAEAGLHFVYAGNAPGKVGRWENTCCPGCGQVLVQREGFLLRGYHLSPQGACPKCARPIPGIWPGENTHPMNSQTTLTKSLHRAPRPVTL